MNICLFLDQEASRVYSTEVKVVFKFEKADISILDANANWGHI